MKLILIAVLSVLAVANAAPTIRDVPFSLLQRIEEYLQLNQQWEQRWASMTPEERERLEAVFLVHMERAQARPQPFFETTDTFPVFDPIPSMPEIPAFVLHTPYGADQLPAAISEDLENFFVRRDTWRQKWESLPADKRELLEQHIRDRTANRTPGAQRPDLPPFHRYSDFLVDMPEVEEQNTQYGEKPQKPQNLAEFLELEQSMKAKWDGLTMEEQDALKVKARAKLVAFMESRGFDKKAMFQFIQAKIETLPEDIKVHVKAEMAAKFEKLPEEVKLRIRENMHKEEVVSVVAEEAPMVAEEEAEIIVVLTNGDLADEVIEE